MVEYVRDKEFIINMEIDTNKQTYRKNMDLNNFNNIDELFEKAKQWWNEFKDELERY